MTANIQTTAWDRHNPQFVVSVKTTWDELFADVGPSMLDEANQSAIEERLDRLFLGLAYDDAIEQTEGWIKSNKVSVSEYDADRGHVSTHDFDTMLLQLRALGLITKSQRNRSVKDTATYWTTPYGDNSVDGAQGNTQGQGHYTTSIRIRSSSC